MCINVDYIMLYNAICAVIYCIRKKTIIASDNGLLPIWHQAINWTNGGLLLKKKPCENIFSGSWNKIY